MKIAVSAGGRDLDAQIDQRFGRCEYFLMVDTDTMEIEAFPNDNRNQTSGAGVQAAGFVIDKGARAVLTGSCGPKAMDVFNAQHIPVHTGHAGSVREAVEAFKTGAPEASGPSKDTGGKTPPSGPGPAGGGRGAGGGGGQGMGGGRGRGGGCGRGTAGGGRGMGGRGGQGMGGGRGMGGGCGRRNR